MQERIDPPAAVGACASRLRIWAGLAGLAAIAASGAAGCRGDAAVGSEATTAPAARETIERVVVATGTIEPEQEVEVRARIAGIVEALHVEAGDQVEAGALLVEIERDLLAAQVREARASLQAAQVEQRYSATDRDRMQALRGGGAASESKLDAARARQETAAAEVARRRATLDRLEVQLGYARVTSPLAGRVLDVPVEVGTAVSPVTAVTGGTLLLSLAATRTLHLEGLVDENEVARVQVGQVARVRTEAYPDRTFEARVRDIAPVGERVQNVTYFEVEVEITDAAASLLRTRMSGDADIVAEVVEDALVIPETALRYEGERIYVELLGTGEPPERVERDVELGILDGGRVQVLSGLQEGEEVVLQ